MKRNVILALLLSSSIFAWQCSRKDDHEAASNGSLKSSLTSGTEKLNQAVSKIAQSRGFEILNLNDNAKSASSQSGITFSDSITLEAIKGIYEYQPINYYNWCYVCGSKIFKKTGESSALVVKLPSEKIFHPHKFQNLIPSDSTLKNNFVITASAYHYYFSSALLHDYKLTAGVAVNDTLIGSIDVQSSASSLWNYSYASEYAFPGDYKVKTSLVSGDTISQEFSLSSSTETLLKETVKFVRAQNDGFGEREYILDIGNVQIIKFNKVDTCQIFVNGVLQKNVKIEVINNLSDTGIGTDISVFKSRDIKITFDDGTSTTVSALIGPSITVLRNLAGSLRDVYFAKNIVNYIAWNIYKNRIQ